MISVPSRSTTGRSLREVERHDRDVLAVDVEPDVELGPVRQREDADRLAAALAARCRGARARAAGSSGPSDAARSGTRRRAPSRATSPRRGARRRTRRRSRASSSACFSALGLHHVGVDGRAVRERIDARRDPVRVRRARAARGRAPRAIRSRNAYMSLELPRRVDVQERERRLRRGRTPSARGAASPRCPCRSSTASPASRRPRDDLAHDLDALRLEPLQVGQAGERRRSH